MRNALETPTDFHLWYLARHMRDSDKLEVRLSHDLCPGDALALAVKSSEWSQAVVWDNRPLCVYGVARQGPFSGVGSPWLLGAKELDQHPALIIRLSAPVVRRMRQGFTLLENWVHADNIKSVRWLQFCGFTIDPAAPFGSHDAMFHHFHMKGYNV